MVGLGVAILFGVVVRLVWPSDMEWKGDEQYLFFHATGSDPFPWLGQASSVGTHNPGMSIWVYSAMVKVLGISTPVGLVRCVMWVNVLALLALLLFVIKVVPARQREPWLWATALLAVNPVAILFSRKLWVQCVLPPFVRGDAARLVAARHAMRGIRMGTGRGVAGADPHVRLLLRCRVCPVDGSL